MKWYLQVWWQGIVFLLGVIFIPAGVAALDCSKALTQGEIEKCVQDEFDAASRDLNIAYKRYLSKLSGEDCKLLESAQQNWERYLEANCRASAATFAEGSLAPTEYVACKLKLTRERLEELKRIYEEPPFPPKQ